jgi:hypothetical protein
MCLAELQPARINARYMTREELAQLVENIRRDGVPTSVPFAALDRATGKYEILSGNHRVQATIAAGIDEADVMLTDDEIPESRRRAIQLSHNEIVGRDDLDIKAQIYALIEDLDDKAYSAIDDKAFAALDQVKLESLSEAQLDFRTFTFLFLPHEVDRIRAIREQIETALAGGETWSARLAEHERLLGGLETIRASHGILNAAAALQVLLDIFENHQTDLADGWVESAAYRGGDWVPVESIFGRRMIPLESAQVIRQAVQRMQDAGDVGPKNLWQAMEYFAASYLAEAE